MTARAWDAASYDRVSGPMEAMGREVLDRLPLRGDETALDAGCGTGRVTALLAERLPAGRVVAADVDPDMVGRARRNLGDLAHVVRADLTALPLDAAVDAILSTATFHWIPDHERLFGSLHDALRPGGRLVAQCGGSGNVARLLEAADAVAAERHPDAFEGFARPHRFVGPEETEATLTRTGFTDVRCWLQPRPVVPSDPLAYLETVTLGPHLDRVPPDDRDAFVRAVADRLGDPVTVDYVRLNIDARRPE